MPTYTTNYNLVMPLPLSPIDANKWGPMLLSNINFQDSYSLSLANNFIGTSQPTIPATDIPAIGQFWINNTVFGSWPVQIYDGTSWVSIGTLNNDTHTFTPVSSITQNYRAIGSSITYTPASNVRYALVQALGGGGGGGGSLAGAGFGAGGGGGGGGISSAFFTYAQMSGGVVITIGAAGTGSTGNGGAGGDTVFGSLMTAKGGSGGTAGANSTSINVTGIGGAGGVLGNGTVNGTGNGGTCGISFGTSAIGGIGGGTFYGGSAAQTNIVGDGVAGTGYGTGGNGAIADPNSARTGGLGTKGLVTIIEYI